MQLYFFRHAIAHPADDHTPDYERALTDEGIARTRRAARLLKVFGVELDALYTSPLKRAHHTADIIGKALDVKTQVRDELSPGFSIDRLEALTRDLNHDDSILLVGHEPDFSTTITSLVGGRVVMKKGGLARVNLVSYQPLLGELVWLLAPKIFEELS